MCTINIQQDGSNNIYFIIIPKVLAFGKLISSHQLNNEPADHDIGQLDHHLSPAPFHSAHMKQAQLPTCNDTWRHDTPTTSYMLLVTWGTRNAPIASSTCGGQEPSHQHLQSALCLQGRKQCAAHLAKEELSKQLSNLPTFYVEGMEIEQVESFTYLGCQLSSADDNFQVCLRDLSKAKKKWGVLCRVLKQDEASMAYKGCTYLIVVSTVLLYGAETWVINAWIQQVLEAFHNCCACHITTWYICHIGTEEDETLKMAKLWPVMEYIMKRWVVFYNTYLRFLPLFDESKTWTTARHARTFPQYHAQQFSTVPKNT